MLESPAHPELPPPDAPEPRLRVREAIGLYVLTLVLLIGVGPLIAPLGLLAIAVSQLALIAAPVLLVARARGRSVREVLGLTAPPPRALAGAALVGASLWIVLALTVVPFIQELAPDQELERLEEIFTSEGIPVWLRLLTFAAIPAVCEELLFRGGIARALGPRFGLWSATLLSAVLFGLFHLSLARLVPTTILGIFLALATLRSGSAIPAMVIHGLNNGLAIAAASAAAGAETDGETSLYPWALVPVAVALALTAWGTWLLWTARRGTS